MKRILTRDGSFYRNLILLAIPIVLQNLITFSVSLADNTMIGSLGDSAVSGVYLGTQIQTVLQVLSAGIESTVLLLSAQYWGKRETAGIRAIAAVGVRISFAIGAALTALCALFPQGVLRLFTKETSVLASGAEYLSVVCYSYAFFCVTQSLIAAMRSVEKPRIGLIVSLCSLCTDVILNYILIFGKFGFPALGVRGAAIATLIARVVETLIAAIYVLAVDHRLAFRVKDLFSRHAVFVKDFLRYGTPLVLGQLVWGANLMANSMVLGRFGEAVITGASLANTVNSMMYVCLNGLSAAVGILIGKAVGAGQLQKIREYSHTVEVLFLLLGLLTAGLFFLIRQPFIGLYQISAEAAAYAGQFIGVLCFTGIGTCYECGTLFGLVKSGGDVSFVFKNDTLFVFGVVIPLSVAAALLGATPWVVYLALKSDQILKCFVAFFKIRKFNWMKNLTRPVSDSAPACTASDGK